MLKFVKPKTIATQTHLAITLIITSLFVVRSCFFYFDTRELILSEQQSILMIIATTLEEKAKNSLDEQYKDVLENRSEENLIFLNNILQPIVDQVAQQYPKYSMGFSSGIKQLAYLEIHDSTITNSPNIIVRLPMFADGEIIAWASVSTKYIIDKIFFFWLRALFITLIAWMLVVLTVKRIFTNIDKSIAELNEIGKDNNAIYLEKVPQLQIVFNSIKTTRAELFHANERFETIFNLIPIILIITELEDMRIIKANSTFLKVTQLSYGEVIGRTFSELNLWKDITKHKEYLELLNNQGYIRNFEMHCGINEDVYTFLVSSKKITIYEKVCWLHSVTDITDKKIQDAELARFDSLNLIGEMAASIGHEVRNPMTTVRGYLQWFQRNPKFASHNEQLKTMIEEIDRANEIITEFLSLAKNKATQMKQGNLNSIVSALSPLMQADALRTGHQLETNLSPIPDTMLDENEIRQLILNLFRNAIEAIDLMGIVTIKTYLSNDYIILEVSDTGRGIPPEIQDKLGTPFCTTKENGTGLGLAVCYRVAQRHRAKIDVDSSSAGTTFSIKFKIA